jgi:hypothetical protein
MTKTNLKFMSDYDIEIANKSISKNEAAILYNAISLAGLHDLNKINTALLFNKLKNGKSPTGNDYVKYSIKDINNLQDKLVRIMESE